MIINTLSPSGDIATHERPIPVPIEPPPGFWRRESSHYPQPLSPMFRIVQAAFNASMRDMMSDFSLLVEAIEFREIGGWVYQRMVPLGGKDRRAPPAWLMPLLIRIVPQLRTRINGCVEVVRSDKVGSYLQRWYAEWKPELTDGIAQLRDIDRARLSDAELDQHVATVIAFLKRSLGIHTRIIGCTTRQRLSGEPFWRPAGDIWQLVFGTIGILIIFPIVIYVFAPGRSRGSRSL